MANGLVAIDVLSPGTNVTMLRRVEAALIEQRLQSVASSVLQRMRRRQAISLNAKATMVKLKADLTTATFFNTPARISRIPMHQ